MEENVIQIDGGITINVNVRVKNVMYVGKKNYIWNPATCSCANGKYLTNIINSAITCNEIIVIRRRNKHYSNKF